MERALYQRLARLPRSWRGPLIAGAHILYAPLVGLLGLAVGGVAVVLGAPLAALTGWLLGRGAGRLSGLILGILAPPLLVWAGALAGPAALLAAALAVLTFVALGDACGRAHANRERLERQAEESLRERAQLSEQILLRQRIEDELRTAKEAAEAASRAKTVFLANVSHELRTPLTTILGYSELLQLKSRALTHEELVADLGRIHLAGDHLLTLVNGVLDLSAIEADRVTLWLERFALGPLLDDVVAIVTPLAERNHNALRVIAPADLGDMVADPLRVRQILLNLLANAARFTEGGTIELRVAREEGLLAPLAAEPGEAQPLIRFEIHDTGVGMTPEQLAHLFQPFFRRGAGVGNFSAGSGLGLALSQRFAQLMGGDIRAISAPGRGSVFTVRLPAAVSVAAPMARHAQSRPRPPVEVPPPPPLDAPRKTVLVVEDDPMNTEIIVRFLTLHGYRTLTAADGAEAISRAHAERPDLILMDMGLPVIDGWTATSRLKGAPDTRGIPILALTAYAFEYDQRRAFMAGCDEFEAKPFSFASLLAKITRLIGPATGPRPPAE